MADGWTRRLVPTLAQEFSLEMWLEIQDTVMTLYLADDSFWVVMIHANKRFLAYRREREPKGAIHHCEYKKVKAVP